MESIKRRQRNGNADGQSRKAVLEKEIEAIRTKLSHLKEKRTASGIAASNNSKSPIMRTPGRFKGKLVVGPEFFDALTNDDIRELTGE